MTKEENRDRFASVIKSMHSIYERAEKAVANNQLDPNSVDLLWMLTLLQGIPLAHLVETIYKLDRILMGHRLLVAGLQENIEAGRIEDCNTNIKNKKLSDLLKQLQVKMDEIAGEDLK